MKKIKAVAAILSGALLIGIPVCVHASGIGRADNIRSYGTFHFEDSQTGQSVHIDSSDFITLAESIDSLEAEYKSAVLGGLNDVGSFFDEEGYFTHDNAVTQPDAVNLSMGSLTDAISHSQDIEGTYTISGVAPNTVTGDPRDLEGAIADNISRGKACWVEGTYVIGNGADNDASYAAGEADGIMQGMNSGNVVITAHFHNEGTKEFRASGSNTAYQNYQSYLSTHNYGSTSSTQSSCYSVYHAAVPAQDAQYEYRICGEWNKLAPWDEEHDWPWECSGCHTICRTGQWSNHTPPTGDDSPPWYHRKQVKVKDAVPAQSAYYSCGCGYTNGEIVSITIEF